MMCTEKTSLPNPRHVLQPAQLYLGYSNLKVATTVENKGCSLWIISENHQSQNNHPRVAWMWMTVIHKFLRVHQ